MQAAIHFQFITDTFYSYEKPQLAALKQHFPELVTYDFDSQSGSWVMGYATELLEKADKGIVILEVIDDTATGFVHFLENILVYKNKCLVLLYGHHPLAERMLSLLEEDNLVRAKPDSDIISMAQTFLSAGQP